MSEGIACGRRRWTPRVAAAGPVVAAAKCRPDPWMKEVGEAGAYPLQNRGSGDCRLVGRGGQTRSHLAAGQGRLAWRWHRRLRTTPWVAEGSRAVAGEEAGGEVGRGRRQGKKAGGGRRQGRRMEGGGAKG